MADVTYGPQTALVVVDVQNDFADPAGSLYVDRGYEVIDVLNEEIARAKGAGALVVYTADWHPESTPHFAKDGGIWPVHCVGDTWGSEFHPDLLVDGPVVKKGTGGEDGYSGFSVRHHGTDEVTDTELGSILRDAGIRHVVIAGLATDYCVKETALDSVRLGFDTKVKLDGIKAVDLEDGDGDRAIEAVSQAGAELI